MVVLLLAQLSELPIWEEAICDALFLSLLVSPALFSVARHVGRRFASVELAAARAQLHEIFTDTTDLIQSTAPDGRILFVDRAWLQALDYDEVEAGNLNPPGAACRRGRPL